MSLSALPEATKVYISSQVENCGSNSDCISSPAVTVGYTDSHRFWLSKYTSWQGRFLYSCYLAWMEGSICVWVALLGSGAISQLQIIFIAHLKFKYECWIWGINKLIHSFVRKCATRKGILLYMCTLHLWFPR